MSPVRVLVVVVVEVVKLKKSREREAPFWYLPKKIIRERMWAACVEGDPGVYPSTLSRPVSEALSGWP